MLDIVAGTSALEEAFPAGVISRVATQESWRKEVNRPATSTHKWWAKRLGSVFRGIISAAATHSSDDPLAAYSSATHLGGMIVLDPFAGSGVTAVEAIKLGARAISFDINPVATLVQRQALQRWDWAEIESAYRRVEDLCRAEIDRVHRTEDGRTVLYYFWVAVAECPDCQDRVRLFDSPVFSKNAYPKRVPKAQIVCAICLDIQEGRFDFDEATCANGHRIEPRGAVRGAIASCSNGHRFKIITALKDKRPDFEMYAKMVTTNGQKTYEPITDWDRSLYAECDRLVADLPSEAVLPSGDLLPGNNTDQALKWNFRRWVDFFNARQLYSLSLLGSAIKSLPAGPGREALATLFSGTLEFNNLFTSFKGEGTGAVRHMFSHHVLKPERTPLEAHPWGTPQSSGSFSTLFVSRLQRARDYKDAPFDLVERDGAIVRERGLSHPLNVRIAADWEEFSTIPQSAYVATRNSAHTDLPSACVDLIVTDPPFMDNVHYAELADFFHAWLREIEPYKGYAIAHTTRRAGEVQHADPRQFGAAIEAVWRECERVLKPDGLMAFTFHQARLSGWIEVIDALSRAGFVVTAIQPVKGEMSTSIVKSGAREPSNLDSIVVCRRRDGAARPLASSLEDALAVAQRSLTALADEGIDVGKGDVRSVMRGHALAFLASCDADLAEQAARVDDAVDQAIARHFAATDA